MQKIPQPNPPLPKKTQKRLWGANKCLNRPHDYAAVEADASAGIGP